MKKAVVILILCAVATRGAQIMLSTLGAPGSWVDVSGGKHYWTALSLAGGIDTNLVGAFDFDKCVLWATFASAQGTSAVNLAYAQTNLALYNDAGSAPLWTNSFNGSTVYAASEWLKVGSAQDTMTGATSMTIMGWVRFDNLTPNEHPLLYSRNGYSFFGLWGYSDGHIQFEYGDPARSEYEQVVSDSNVITNGGRYFLVGTWGKNAHGKIYINGIEKVATYYGTGITTGPLGQNDYLYVGWDDNYAWQKLSGAISQVALFRNFEATSNAIWSYYTATAGAY